MSAIKTILRLFFVCGKDVYDIYRTWFQIEFCFRDGHQFTGLLDCHARDEKALDFACNASLAPSISLRH